MGGLFVNDVYWLIDVGEYVELKRKIDLIYV